MAIPGLVLGGGGRRVWVLVVVRDRLRARRGRRLAAAAADVGLQHLQQQVVDQHHVLPLHGGQVVHAFVTTETGSTAHGMKAT